jgi:hypothetical protein
MEEIEVPVDQIQEDMHERIHHEAAHGNEHAGLNSKIALSSAILAVFAAISALLAGHHSNEAMIEQLHASDQWGYYQAKGIKSAILSSRADLLEELGKPKDEKTEAKLEAYKKDQEAISEKAKESEKESVAHLAVHQTFARAVTFFQIAITIAAIAILTHRKRFWFVSLGFGLIGLISFIQGLIQGLT